MSPSQQKLQILRKKKQMSKYVPNVNERYMSKKQYKYFQDIFNKMLADISASSEKTIVSLKDEISVISDDSDRASKESEFNLELRERERESRLEVKIDYALKRINEKTFGYCEECGSKIGIERLLARPVAVLCFECKNLQETQEKSYA